MANHSINGEHLRNTHPPQEHCVFKSHLNWGGGWRRTENRTTWNEFKLNRFVVSIFRIRESEQRSPCTHAQKMTLSGPTISRSISPLWFIFGLHYNKFSTLYCSVLLLVKGGVEETCSVNLHSFHVPSISSPIIIQHHPPIPLSHESLFSLFPLPVL